MTILCSLKNLNLSFGDKKIFDNSELQIEHGDHIGLIGLNGKGKSSLFKILTGELDASSAEIPFVFDKATTKQGKGQEYSVFLVPQQFKIPTSPTKVGHYVFEFYPKLKEVYEELEKVNSSSEIDLEKQQRLLKKQDDLGLWEIVGNFESYLKSFGIKDLSRDVITLSGGEQKKVLLSLGFTSNANLILWDEPTNHLDIETIGNFEERLKRLDKTFIIITHDRYLLSKVCNKIFHINKAKISSFKGSYADYLAYLNVEEENRKKALEKLQNSLRRETEWMRQGIKARGTRSKKRVESFHDLSQKVQNIKDDARRQMSLMINDSNRKTKKLVQFKDVSFGYDDELFTGLDFTLYKGDKLGVLGPNGVGKSSLMKLIARELTPLSGKSFYADDLKICYFGQKREELSIEQTPYDLLGEGQEHITFSNGRSIHVASYFQNFLFSRDELRRPLSSFSGGEINRLQLAMNLKNEADIWIFDEPTNDLDIESIEILEQKLCEFKGTLILISHDRSFLENVTNKVWLIKNKEIEVFSSGYSQVAPYLEACAIEEGLKKEQKTAPERSMKEKKAKKGMNSYQIKERLKKLPSIIEEDELLLENLEYDLSNFDYTEMNEQKVSELEKLNKKREKIEEGLLSLYEEYEELEKLQK